MDKNNVEAHVLISGNVQGVFFRIWAKNNAKKLGIVGWIKNTTDGRVEALLQGDKEKVEEMIAIFREGSPTSKVDNVDIQMESVKEEIKDFQILF